MSDGPDWAKRGRAVRPRGGRSRVSGVARTQNLIMHPNLIMTGWRRKAPGPAEACQRRDRLREIAGRRGMSLREAGVEFVQLHAEAPRGRQRCANAEELRDLGAMPTDPATRHAVATMQARHR